MQIKFVSNHKLRLHFVKVAILQVVHQGAVSAHLVSAKRCRLYIAKKMRPQNARVKNLARDSLERARVLVLNCNKRRVNASRFDVLQIAPRL